MSSTAPAVTGISFDRQAYNPGDLITVTVTGTAGSQIGVRNFTGTAAFTDAASGLSGTLSGLASITSPVEDTTTAGFSDTDGRLYSLKSLAQTPAGVVTAVFTATA
jgi:hypothetical protein